MSISPAHFSCPTPAELEILGVLWSAEEDAALAQPALPRAHKPQQIRELLLAHREQRGEDILDPKVTTVSTMLRSMVEKRLLREVRLLQIGRAHV